jgi:hypothetical protein
MEPVFMMSGQVAGTAASLAVDGKTSVQDVPYAALRERLLADRQILTDDAPRTRPKSPPGSTSSAATMPDAQLAADVQVLVAKGIADSADYWLAHAQRRGRCQSELVEALMMRMANALEPAKTHDEALRVLAARRVITSPDFWKERIDSGDPCPGEYVRTVIRNFVQASAASESGKRFPTQE